MKSIEDLASEAALLPKDQRFTLAYRILSSVEPEVEAAIEAEWDLEIRKRIDRFDGGLAVAVPGERVFAELDRQFKR
jgi:hypothetical protein